MVSKDGRSTHSRHQSVRKSQMAQYRPSTGVVETRKLRKDPQACFLSEKGGDNKSRLGTNRYFPRRREVQRTEKCVVIPRARLRAQTSCNRTAAVYRCPEIVVPAPSGLRRRLQEAQLAAVSAREEGKEEDSGAYSCDVLADVPTPSATLAHGKKSALELPFIPHGSLITEVFKLVLARVTDIEILASVSRVLPQVCHDWKGHC
jgi:hypothetical protein